LEATDLDGGKKGASKRFTSVKKENRGALKRKNNVDDSRRGAGPAKKKRPEKIGA